jgi:hypothetical protein
MLSEKITLFQQNTSTKMCHFAKTVESLSADDQKALMDAVGSDSISARALEKILYSEGIQLCKDTIVKARFCSQNNNLCKCGFMRESSK